MPRKIKPVEKSDHNVVNQHTYPSNIDDMMRNDMDFEGKERMLPPNHTNPIPGADGTLPMSEFKKTK